MKEAWELFLHGGFVMWPLLVALIIAVAIAIERIAYYRQLKREMFALNDALEESEMNWQSLLTTLGSKYTANISYNLPRVLGQCQNRNVLQSKMEDMVAHVYTHASRGLDWLSTIITIAPLLGLLGTVTGMIGSFSILDAGAGASAITGGVGEALIATASGLCVAIMAFIVYTFFSHRLDSIINQIEGMCVNIVSAKREGWN